MPGYPCCCNTVTACLFTDDFNGRGTINSPAGTWCQNYDAGACITTNTPTLIQEWQLNAGKLVGKGGVGSAPFFPAINSAIMFNQPTNNTGGINTTGNRFDVSTKMAFFNNPASQGAKGYISLAGLDNRSAGAFVLSAYMSSPADSIPTTLNSGTEYTLRLSVCQALNSVPESGKVFAKTYFEGDIKAQGWTTTAAWTSIPFFGVHSIPNASGNSVSYSLTTNLPTGVIRYDDYSIQYFQRSGCDDCETPDCYPYGDPDEISLQIGGFTDCTRGCCSSNGGTTPYDIEYSQLNGTYSLSKNDSAVIDTGTIGVLFDGSKYEFCHAYETTFAGVEVEYTPVSGTNLCNDVTHHDQIATFDTVRVFIYKCISSTCTIPSPYIYWEIKDASLDKRLVWFGGNYGSLLSYAYNSNIPSQTSGGLFPYNVADISMCCSSTPMPTGVIFQEMHV